VVIACKLAQQLTRLEQEFGMTPAARTRLAVTGAPQAGRKYNADKARYLIAR
jgi:phage terminase small subunit